MRVRDYCVLLAVSAALTLPNLGATSLWDMDEGVNAQAAREMREAGTWIVPTFNYQLRTAKPVFLYWTQRASYAVFGVSEWSARLPSAVAGWLAVLLTYELARRMFGRATGLLAGLVLASVVQFGVLARAATPDAVLLLFTTLTFLLFWVGHENGSTPATFETARAGENGSTPATFETARAGENGSGGRKWFVPVAAVCGLAVLTKGPVGVALPGVVVLAYFAWNRELRRLLDRRLAWAALAFVLVAGPWYGLVSNETRGEWLKAFFGRENVGRFLSPLDDHRGPVVYYLLVLPVMFAPWSVFLFAAAWYGVKAARVSVASGGREPPELTQPPSGGSRPPLATDTRAHRLLVCWVAAFLVFFSAAATKLPNYVFPLYPALAILTARFLVRWLEGGLAVPRWFMPAAAAGLAVVGVTFAGLLLFADRTFPGLAVWAAIGLVPVAGAGAMALALRRGDRPAAVTACGAAAVGFLGLLTAFGPAAVDRRKAPRELVRLSGAGDPARDLRVAAFRWFQPSVVFYTGREVKELPAPDDVAVFLAVPTPAYLFVPEAVWRELRPAVGVPCRVVAKHHDFLRKCDVVVVTNEAGRDVAKR